MNASKGKGLVFTWAFEEGVLVVTYRGKRETLGPYATRELAAKAASAHLAMHGGK